MIYIRRDNEDVVVNFITDLPHDCKGESTATLWFRFSTKKPYLAQLLADHLMKRLDNAVENARREEYERGWKDKAAKRKKITWFKCRL